MCGVCTVMYRTNTSAFIVERTELLARQGLTTSSCNSSAPKNMDVIAVASPLLQIRGASSLLFSTDGYPESHTLPCIVCENPSSTIAATAAAEPIYGRNRISCVSLCMYANIISLSKHNSCVSS